jgi:hypothetical protein
LTKYRLTADKLRVAYGGLDRTKLATINLVTDLFQHELYDTPTQLNYDYSVLRLQDKIQTSDTVKTIELIDASPPVGSKAQLTGWGRTIGTDPNSAAVQLQYAEFTTITREECQRRADNTITKPPTVTSQFICGENKSASGCYVCPTRMSTEFVNNYILFLITGRFRRTLCNRRQTGGHCLVGNA